MVEVWLPYGKIEVPVRIPDENFIGVLDKEEEQIIEKPIEGILRAIENPIGSKKLNEIAKPKDKTAIIIEDELSLSNITIPPLIQKLSTLGIEESQITIILGSKIQAFTELDYRSILAQETGKRVNVVKAKMDTRDYTQVGCTSRGTEVHIKNAFIEADLRILTGRIGFHPYSGYIGGRSGVLPAICGVKTIQQSGSFILDSNAKTGRLDGNPLHQEMMEAAQLAEVNFIINVILNTKGEVVNTVAGDLNQAFLQGVKLLDEKWKVYTEQVADIVIFSSGGYPWDTTLSRACEGLTSTLNIVKDDGVIIWLAECPEGFGSNTFYNWMAKFKTPREAALEIKRKFILDGDLAYLLLDTINRVKVILVSILPDYYAKGIFKLRTARTVNTALNLAFKTLNKKGKVLVLPHGNTIYPSVKRE